MARSRKTPGAVRVPADIVSELNQGSRESSNLMEGLAVDFTELIGVVIPDIDDAVRASLSSSKLSITERMRRAGEICLEHLGLNRLDEVAQHSSDTVRGWAAYMVGLDDHLTFRKRLELIRPLADDSHFGVREWAWMALRPHIVQDVALAIRELVPWTAEESHLLRRFATEATRPRGVWCEHIVELKEKPALGLPLLRPLRADPERYVQDSVSNWINDAAKSKPDWARDLVRDWSDDCDDPNTLRICRRAVRSIGPEFTGD